MTQKINALGVLFLVCLAGGGHAQQTEDTRLSIADVETAIQDAGLNVGNITGAYGGVISRGVYFANVRFDHAGVGYEAEALTIDIETGDLWLDTIRTANEDRGVISARSVTMNLETLGDLLSDTAWPSCTRPLIDLQPVETRLMVSGLTLQADADMVEAEQPETTQAEAVALKIGNKGDTGACDLTAEWLIEDFRSQSAALDRIQIDAISGSVELPNGAFGMVFQLETDSSGDIPARATAGQLAVEGIRAVSSSGYSLGEAERLEAQFRLSSDFMDVIKQGNLSSLPFPPPDGSMAISATGVYLPLSGVYMQASRTEDDLTLIGDGTFGLQVGSDKARLGAFLEMPRSIDARLNIETSFNVSEPGDELENGLFARMNATVLDHVMLEVNAPLVATLMPNASDRMTSILMDTVEAAPVPGRVKANISGLEDGIRSWLDAAFSSGGARVSARPPKPINLASLGAAFVIRPQIAADSAGFSSDVGKSHAKETPH